MGDKRNSDSRAKRTWDHQGMGMALSPSRGHREKRVGRNSDRHAEVSLSHLSQIFQYLYGMYKFSKTHD